MRFIRAVARYPIAVLGLFALAFVIWLWRDAIPINQPDPLDADQVKMAQNDPDWPPRKKLPAPIAAPFVPLPPGGHPLAKIKPGMTRAEVEELVGAPAPQDIHPVTVADGKVTYMTAYEADLGPAATIRPITPRAHAPKAPAGRTVVTLEYDATKPGHPLLGIHYPDPLF
jgi:hypothetical protein